MQGRVISLETWLSEVEVVWVLMVLLVLVLFSSRVLWLLWRIVWQKVLNESLQRQRKDIISHDLQYYVSYLM